VDPHDPQSIASAIGFIVSHPDEAREMGQRGRCLFEKQFNWGPRSCVYSSFTIESLTQDRALVHVAMRPVQTTQTAGGRFRRIAPARS